MPAEPRKNVVDPEQTGIYHCFNRCVRRAFLCGQDPYSGRNYDHRKDWIHDRLKLLSKSFAIDVLDYSAMDNHLHVLLRNRPDVVAAWSDREVARRWWNVCPLRRDKSGRPAEPQDIELKEWLESPRKMIELRRRLKDISWYMKLLCENIARRANREDEIGGKFWESRFKCTSILDEIALLACSMYVNLNPIRAGMALVPELARHTSVYDRIEALLASGLRISPLDSTGTEDAAECESLQVSGEPASGAADDWLCRLPLQEVFESSADDGHVALAMANTFPAPRPSNKGYLSMSLRDYLKLLDFTGRQIRNGKGAIPAEVEEIGKRLKIDLETLPDVVLNFNKWFRSVAGNAVSLKKEAQRRNRKWLHGIRRSAVFP